MSIENTKIGTIRILSNGLRYRIQIFKMVGWFFLRPKWVYPKEWIVEYHSFASAKEEAEKLSLERKAELTGWQVKEIIF